VSARARRLAVYVRRLPDDDLNDVLVELPPGRFAQLVEVALARPCVPDALTLSFHRAAPRHGEATRWDVAVSRPLRARDGDRLLVRVVIGAVACRTWPTDRGTAVAGWVTSTRAGGQATSQQPVRAGACWPTRWQAAAALAWRSPASGARCLVLAAHVRALPDDDLGDLLVELPCERFDRLLRAALGAPVRAGEAA
jgi:hypothetical protein